MKTLTNNTSSAQVADGGSCIKAIKAFRSYKIAYQVSSKNIMKGFIDNGIIEGFKEPSPLTYRKYLFLMRY